MVDRAMMPKSMNIRDLRIENAQLKAEIERLQEQLLGLGRLCTASNGVLENLVVQPVEKQVEPPYKYVCHIKNGLPELMELRAALESSAGANRRSAGAEEGGGGG